MRVLLAVEMGMKNHEVLNNNNKYITFYWVANIKRKIIKNKLLRIIK